MIILHIDIGQSQVDSVFKEKIAQLTQMANRTTQRLGDFIEQHAQDTTRFSHGNNFNQGIKFQLLSSTEGQVTSQVYTSAGVEYSQFLQYGNGPQGVKIHPVHAKAFHFFTYGNEVFAKNISTISINKLGFMTDAQLAGQIEAPHILAEEWNAIFK